jgi:hypothetical protein
MESRLPSDHRITSLSFSDNLIQPQGWLSLPKQIKYLRVNGLEPGEHTIKIDYGCGVETKKIRVEKDKVSIAYFAYAK